MWIPTPLYTAPRTGGKILLQSFFDSDSTSAASGTINVEIQLGPDTAGDRVLLLHNLCGLFTPGAGQTADLAALLVTSPTKDTVARDYFFEGNWVPGAAAQSKFLSWQGVMVLYPMWRIRARGQFSAAGVANSVTVWANGVFVPRGNFAETLNA